MTLKQIYRAKEQFPSFRVEPQKLQSDFEVTLEEVLRWARDKSSSPSARVYKQIWLNAIRLPTEHFVEVAMLWKQTIRCTSFATLSFSIIAVLTADAVKG